MTQSLSQKVSRLFEIRDRFEAGARCSVVELAEEFGVSRRTIFRDIELLRELDFPLAIDKTTHAYFLPEEATTNRIPFVDGKSVAIVLLAAHVSPLSQVPGGTHLIRSASARLLNQLPAADRARVGRLLSMCVQEESEESLPIHMESDVLLDLVAGLQGRGSVELTYRDSQDRMTTAGIFLRQLKYGKDGWYVEGRHLTRGESIRIRLDQIHSVSTETNIDDARVIDRSQGPFQQVRGR